MSTAARIALALHAESKVSSTSCAAAGVAHKRSNGIESFEASGSVNKALVVLAAANSTGGERCRYAKPMHDVACDSMWRNFSANVDVES